MELKIREQISLLRKKKKITQEQLAVAVGVSAPAVSKWESGQSCPDIALLPPLARYFGTTVDALLGYQPDLTGEQVQEIAKECAESFEKEGWQYGLALCQNHANQYPCQGDLLVALASALQRGAIFAPGEEEVARAQALQEQWLEAAAQWGNGLVPQSAQYMLACLCMGDGRHERAEELLRELPQPPGDCRSLLPTLYLNKKDW